MKNIVLFGGGGHAKVIADIIEREGKYSIVGFVDPKFKIGESWFNRYKIISMEEALTIGMGIVAIGDNSIRKKQVDEVLGKKSNFQFVTSIHPSAIIGRDVEIGSGVVIMAGAIINTSSFICDHVVVNSGAVIEHDCRLGNYSFIAPSVTMGGNCKVDDYAFVGIGASLKQGVHVLKNSIVAMGAVVINDLPENVVAVGCPAKIIKKRNEGDKFF